MSVIKRRGGYQANVQLRDGTRRRYQFDNYEAARNYATAAAAAVKLNLPLPPKDTQPEQQQTLGAAFRLARGDWENQAAHRDLIRNGQYVLNYFGSDIATAEITPAGVMAFKEHWKARGNSGATINRKLAALSVMLRKGKHKVDFERFPEGKGRIHWLDDNKEDKLMEHWDRTGDFFNRDLCVFLIDTGLRIYREAGTLEWDHISEDRVYTEGKGNKVRTVPLTKRSYEATQRQCKGDLGPWYGLQQSHLAKSWGRMRTETGMDWLTPHVLRHTCASRLVMGGVDASRVQAWMGHSSITTTMRYIHLAPDVLFDCVNVLER